MKQHLFICALLILASGYRVCEAQGSGVVELMNQSKFALALSKLEHTNEFTEDHRWYLKGICEAATDDYQSSAASFKTVVSSYPDSKWRTVATRLLHCVEQMELNSDRVAVKFAELIQKIKQPELIIEVECADEQTEYVVGIDFKNGEWQISHTRNHVPFWVFSSNQNTSKWYQQNKSEITEFDGGMFPTFQVDLTKNGDQSFSIHLSGKLTSDSTQLASTLDRFSSSKWLSTHEGLKEAVVVRKLQHGTFLESVSSRNEKTTCRWFQPEFSEPACSKSHWDFIGDSGLRLISADSQVQIRAFTSTKSNGLKKMKWPSVKTVKRDVDLNLANELMSRIRDAMDGSKDIEKVADQDNNQFQPAQRR